MSKLCIINTIKTKIRGNATSYIERENEIFIPKSDRFTLEQTYKIAVKKVDKINQEYLSEKFGKVVSLNTSASNGTGIKIHPSQLLIDAYEVKEGNKSIEELNPRNLDYFNGDEALLEQEQNDKLKPFIDESKKIADEIKDVEQQVQEKTIKPGVEELFESNPELANAVYEALGYNTSNIDLKINRVGNRINVVTSSSNNKAQIDIDIEGKSAYITNTFVEKEQQGFGTLSYIKLGNELIKQGLTLTSDLNGVDLQESGKALWESLASKNLAFYNPNIGRYVFSGQQAQQLYSQYLDTIKSNVILPTDRIVFGHPTIGKSYLKQKGNNNFITLDDDYANEVNTFIDANRGSETRQEYKGRKPQEYNEFMLNLFDRLKVQAKKEGKKLFVSNTNILKERMSEFDKVITIPKDEFKKRFDARGATYGFEDWKSDIDTTISKVDKSKVISTTGYLSDLLEGSKQDIENFAKFVKNNESGNTKDMENYMSSKSVDYIMDKLIQSGKIEKRC